MIAYQGLQQFSILHIRQLHRVYTDSAKELTFECYDVIQRPTARGIVRSHAPIACTHATKKIPFKYELKISLLK